jgi:hypothetical protein
MPMRSPHSSRHRPFDRRRPTCPSLGRGRVSLLVRTGAALLAATMAHAPPTLHAQDVSSMRYGVLMDDLRNTLAGDWTDEPHQVERTYCVTEWWPAIVRGSDSGDRAADTLFRVAQAKAMAAVSATPNGASFACAAGVPELHTHPPATCYGDRVDQCYAGGPDAYSCQPSREDVRTLLRRGDRFAIIQCDRFAYVFYYPGQFVASSEVASARIRDPYAPRPSPMNTVMSAAKP